MPVPPIPVARAANRVRDSLGRLHDAASPPFLLLLERLFGIVDNKALYCAVVLDLPDLLADGPRSASELATEADADPDAIERLLRFLIGRGFFRELRTGQIANNGASALLCRDHPYSWRGWVEFFGSDWNWEIWNQMPERIRTGASAPVGALGSEFFEYVNDVHPEAGVAFNEAMAAGSRVQGALFAEAIDVSGIGSLCDVGGGTGSVLAHILRTHPQIAGTVFDLPRLEASAIALLANTGVEDRAKFDGGDFFESVPQGHDLYTLFAVIHDWGDDDCVRILSNVRDALPQTGRIMVIERPMPSGTRPDFTRSSDLLMLMLSDGGRERTAAEYGALFGRASLRIVDETRLASLFSVFELGV